MADAEEVAGRLFNRVDGKMITAIDHLAYRLAQLILGTMLLAGIGGLLLMRGLRRGPASA